MRTGNRTNINPAYDPRSDDGSVRYMAVQHNLMDPAAHADEAARARQSVRNILRKRPAFTLDLDKEYLNHALAMDNIRRPKFEHGEQSEASEWLTTALRHKPFHRGHLSDIFIREATSYDEYD
eukprot:8576078-Pyramimonas_sp.AAC.1